MPEYITIPEFARRAGVTPQAIYSRLDKDLSIYFKMVDKRKMIDIQALSMYSSQSPTQETAQDVVNDTSELTREIERLRGEIAAKDALIASYTERLMALSEQLTELVKRDQELRARALMPVEKKSLWKRIFG